MKNYLKLFLILVSFGYVLNVAQAEIPEGIMQAHEAVWKFVHSDDVKGTAFFIGSNQVVTHLHTMYGVGESYKKSSINDFSLAQGDKKINLKKILYASAIFDLVILETKEEVSEYLHFSEKEPSGRLYALGYPQGVKKTLIHSEEYGIFDNGYDYLFPVNQSILDGIGGGPVLDKQIEVVGVAYKSIDNMLRVRKMSQIEALKGGLGIDCSIITTLASCIEAAIIDLEEEAKKDPLAQESLAMMYSHGIGVDLDEEKAFGLYLKSAKQGHASAQYEVAFMYLIGLGVNKDEGQAFYWMAQSADQSYAPAQYMLGLMYYHGIGVPQEDEEEDGKKMNEEDGKEKELED